MLKKHANKKNGFTLTEIMVVVGLVVVLASIAISSGLQAKKVARDNQRKTDIRFLQVKLEDYRGRFGLYPTSLSGTSDSLVSSGIIPSSVVPKDPSSKTEYQYVPLQFSGEGGTCGASYRLGAEMENNTDISSPVSINSSLVTCGGTFNFVPNKTYDVTSPI